MSEEVNFVAEVEQLKLLVMKQLEVSEETATNIVDQATEEVWRVLGEERFLKLSKKKLLKYIGDMVGLIMDDAEREKEMNGAIPEVQALFARLAGREILDDNVLPEIDFAEVDLDVENGDDESKFGTMPNEALRRRMN